MGKKKTRTSAGSGLSSRDRPGSSGGGSMTSRGNPGGPGSSNNNNKEQQQRLVSSPSLDEEGAYSNKRMTYICTSLIGNTVSVETDDGIVYEGVFRTFSPDLDITLEQLHQVDKNDPTRINPETVKSTGVFSMKRIIRCMALDVDLNAARMDQGQGFMTDTQISGNKINGERRLEMWMPDPDEEHGVSLELEAEANGWSPEDMFKANEESYGVQSTFKSNLEGYTVQLNADKGSEKFRELEAKAEAIAREIEGSGTNNLAIELENGDEEEAFSAVVRSGGRGGDGHGRGDGEGGKYVPPGRRPPQQQQSGGNPRNTQQQNNSPMSRGGPPSSIDNSDRRSNRRDFNQASQQPQGGSSAHSGRDQHYQHDDYARSGAGRGRGQYPPKDQNSAGRPGGRMDKSRNEQTAELKSFRDNFHLSSSDGHQRQYYEKQPSPPNRGSPNDHHRKGPSPGVANDRRPSPPTASIRQDSVEPAPPSKTPPTAAPPPAAAVASPASSTVTPSTPAPAAAAPAAAPAVTKSKLNPNAGEFVLNPKAKEFIPPSARPPVGQTPPPPRPMTPATPTGGQMPPMGGYYHNMQAPGGFNPYMPAASNVSAAVPTSFIYAPTSQPPPQYTQQHRFRGGAPANVVVSSASGGPRDANTQVLACTGQPLLPHQNNFIIPPMPAHMQHQVQQATHQHQQIAMPGNMVPVSISSGGPVMVRPMEGGWPLQPNQQPPPHMAGHHPPPSGTPTSANQPPMSVTPPTSGIVQPPTGNHQQPPQMPGANGQNQPGAAAAAAAGMYNFMQHQSLPHQFTATYPQLLQLHGQPSLLQQPMMTQGQPVTSMASGNIQFPYGVPQSHHGVVPGQQSSPQFIIPHMAMPIVSVANPVAAASVVASAAGGQAQAGQMQPQPPPQGGGGPPQQAQWGGYSVDEESLQMYHHPMYPPPYPILYPIPVMPQLSSTPTPPSPENEEMPASDTHQQQSFHAEEKPSISLCNTNSRRKSTTTSATTTSTTTTTTTCALLTPSTGSTHSSSSSRKVSVSSSASSPKRPRIMSGSSQGNFSRASPSPTYRSGTPTGAGNKTWHQSPSPPSQYTVHPSPEKNLPPIPRHVQNGPHHQHYQRAPRTFYSTGYDHYQHRRNYQPPARGGYHRHGGGGHYAQGPAGSVSSAATANNADGSSSNAANRRRNNPT